MSVLIYNADRQNSQLRLDEYELRALLLQLPGGVIIADAPSGAPIYQNTEATRLLRHPLLHAENCERYIHGAFHADGRKYQPGEYPIARALAGETVRQQEIVYRRGDGTLGYFMANAVPIHNRAGAVSKALVTFFDISEWHKTRLALKDSEKRLSIALGGADIAFWELDIATGNAAADDKAFILLGYRPGEIGQSFNTWLSLMHMDDKQGALNQWFDFLEGKIQLYDAALRLRTRHGDWKWIALRAQIIQRDARGKPLRAAGTARDIDAAKRLEIALRDNEERFRCTMRFAAIGIAAVALSGRWLIVNPKLTDILGYAEEELLHRHAIKDVIHPDDLAQYEHAYDALLQAEIPAFNLEQRFLRKDGQTIWVDLTMSSVRDDQGRVKYLVSVIDDKTARKRAEQELLDMQARLQMATEIARLGFWEWNPHNCDLYLSPEWKAQLGYRNDELACGRAEWEALAHPDDLQHLVQKLETFAACDDPECVSEFRMRHKDGTYRWVSAHAVRMMGADGKTQKIVGTQLDITDHKAAQEQVRQLAQHDALTGLPNRGLLYEFSEHLLAAARRAYTPLAVLFFDIDRFKAVNDTHGHKVGDAVLKEMAHRINQVMRAEDVIGRLGGDEFVAILPKIRGRDDAAVAASKALESLRQPYRIEQLELTLSPSIGISLFPIDGDAIDSLIQKADAAMYRVKNSGCNNFQFFTVTPADMQHHEVVLESRLRDGLARDEFDLAYQPVIDTRTGAVTGAEALLRWQRPGGEPIDPSDFIPIAETSGLILPLGEWILRRACRQHQQWLSEGLPPIPIGVHASSVQLRGNELQRCVERVLAATGIDPACLEIEVTESMVMRNIETAVNVLRALKDAGLKITLEDFGTGSSNLTELSRLPFDKLKVDQSFVRRLANDRSSVAIADAIIALGRALGIVVVAEGIESERDLDWVKAHDCHQAQGFHLGRPMSGPKFAQWYREHRLH